jgi:Leucine-rich repeat (LRR) protein
MRGARPIHTEELKKIAGIIQTHLEHPSGVWRDVILEKIPLLSNFLSLSNQVQKLEQWVRWDGRLDSQSRKQSFELIRRVALEGDKITQLNALESLAKIAHGIGLKDLLRLRQAGYSPAELSELLSIKATALADLIQLSSPEVIEENKAQFGKRRRLLTSAPRRLYASYLLWWLGQSTAWWTQRLPFALLKIVKLGLEALFLQKIAASILEAIHCPDKPGFQFGNGYQDWAADYTAECFTARIKFFRTLDTNENVDALVTEIPQYHLMELTTLSLFNKYLTSEEALQIVQAVAQQGAPLRTLDLSSNHISVLSEGALSGLSQLISLDLSSNQISDLSDGVLGGVSQLTSLDLGSNKISDLSEGMFRGLSQLTVLYLHGNQISVLSDGALGKLSQLISLDLSDNQINLLSESMFSGLNQLASLDLIGNQISDLSENVFNGLNQLTSLNLDGNQINILSKGVFSELNQLITLNLNSNLIIALGDGVFSGLSQLTTLNLGDNQISVLNKGAFSELSQLIGLDLSGNRISAPSEGVWSGLSQLQVLDLSDNFLNSSSIISILTFLPMTLTELDISSDQISSLPQNFSTLLPVGLKSLSVGGNRFIPRELTQEFMQYFPFQLTTLGLEFSFIVKITDNSFSNFSVLTTLNLNRNQISILSDSVFSGLSQLTSLDLSSNQIGVLSEGVLNGLSRLTYLNLGDNQISVLSEGMLNELSQLTTLDLHGNQINLLGDRVLDGLNQLTTLYLNGNQISLLSEDMLSGLRQLHTLYLDGNQISILSESVFSGLNQLTALSLNDNQLNDTTIQNLTQNFPYQLNQLDVSDNQIGNDGALALAGILPCTNLTTINFAGNPANNTAVVLASQQTALKKVCDDQRCHANLPASESCGVNINPSITTQLIWELFNSTVEIDKAESDLSDYAYWPHPTETPPFQSALALSSDTPKSISSSLTPATAGIMMLGVLGLSVLLYKNSIWMQAIVNTGSHFFQRCCSGRRTEEAKTISPVSSSNRRYTLFPYLPTFYSRKNSSFTTVTSVALR